MGLGEALLALGAIVVPLLLAWKLLALGLGRPRRRRERPRDRDGDEPGGPA
jgi:hypothetical protein